MDSNIKVVCIRNSGEEIDSYMYRNSLFSLCFKSSK